MPLGQTESLTYDSENRMTSRTDFSGETTTFVWDAAGLLTDRLAPAGSGDSDISGSHNAAGEVATMTDSTGTTT